MHARTSDPLTALAAAVEGARRGLRVGVATVLARHGSAPSTPGQKVALVGEEALGTIGGGAVEFAVLAELRRAVQTGASPRVHTFRLGPTLGMCCGGSVEVLVETLAPVTTVLLVGGGHVARATAPLLAGLGFRVVACDARDDAARAWEAEDRAAFVPASHDEPAVLAAVGDPTSATCLVMTHDHQLDQAAVEWALGAGFAFVGGVGSRAKAARTAQRLEAKGFPEAERARVRMPIGLDIGARTPEEIALAIAAELVRVRSARGAEAPRGADREAPPATASSRAAR